MKMHTSATRSGGKQIDTWKFDIAGQPRQGVSVSLVTSQGGSHFEARGKTDLVKGLTWSDSDIAKLQTEVNQHVLDLANDLLDASWTPAFVVKSNNQTVGGNNLQAFAFHLSWAETLRDTSKPPSNFGEHDVLRGTHMTRILERAHDQIFETKSNDLSAANLRLREDEGHNITLIDGTPENFAALEELRDFLRLFSAKVLDRLSPNAVSSHGVPTKAEIAALMQQASQHFAEGLRAPEEDPEKFRF